MCHQISTSTPSSLSKYFHERNVAFFPRRSLVNKSFFTFNFWNNIEKHKRMFIKVLNCVVQGKGYGGVRRLKGSWWPEYLRTRWCALLTCFQSNLSCKESVLIYLLVNLVLFSLNTKLIEDRHYACTTILYCQHWEQGFRKTGSQSILNEGMAWLRLEKCVRLRWFEVKRGSFPSRKNKMSQLLENLKTKETELQ